MVSEVQYDTSIEVDTIIYWKYKYMDVNILESRQNKHKPLIIDGGVHMVNDGADNKINNDILDTFLTSVPDKYKDYNPMFFGKIIPNNYFMLATPYISRESADIYKRFDKEYGGYNAVNIDEGFPVTICSDEIVFLMDVWISSLPKWRFKHEEGFYDEDY